MSEFAYPIANKILGKTSGLAGAFFDNQTGEQVHFTEVNHYGGDKQVGADEYWEVQGDDGETYFITEDGEVRDTDDSVVGAFEVFASKIAATIETTLPAEGYHIGTDFAFKQAGMTAHVTLPPVGAFPEGTTIEFPGGFRPYMDWVSSYWDDHGGIVPMDDVPVTITADDPQAAEAVIESARRGGRMGATQEAMKCPECGSHSFRAMHVDKDKMANLKCLTCGHDWRDEVTDAPKNRYSVSWDESQGTEFADGFGNEGTELAECPMCGGPGELMGTLGQLDHYRCRNCGAQFNLRGGVDNAGYGPDSGYQHQGTMDKEAGPRIDYFKDQVQNVGDNALMVGDAFGGGAALLRDYTRDTLGMWPTCPNCNQAKLQPFPDHSGYEPCSNCGYKVYDGDRPTHSLGDDGQYTFGDNYHEYQHQLRDRSTANQHAPGTRIEVVHPSNKGQRGSILKHKGTDNGVEEDTYDILLDNGEKAEGLRGSDFKKIKSARSDEMFLESIPIMPQEGEYGYHYADYDWAAWGDGAQHHHLHPDVPDDGRYLETFPCPKCGHTGKIKKVAEVQGDYPSLPQQGEGVGNMGAGQYQCDNCGYTFAGPDNPADFFMHTDGHTAAPIAPMTPGGTVQPMQQQPQTAPGLQQSTPCPNCGSTSVTSTGTFTQTGAPWYRCNSCGTMYQGQGEQTTSALGDEPHLKIPLGLLDDVIGLGGGSQAGKGNSNGTCPTCGAGPEAAHPLEAEPPVEGAPSVNMCTNCGSLYSTDAHTDHETAPADQSVSKVAFTDHHGNPMTPGNWYVMRSLKYKVPDVIQVLNLEDNRIEASIEGDVYGTFPLHILAEEIESEGYSFEPYIHEVPGLPDPTGSQPNERARQIIDQISEILGSGQGTEQEIDALVKQYYAIQDGMQEQMEQVQQPAQQQAPGLAFGSWHFARRNFSPSEQRALVDENLEGRARNFDKLNLDGTHYNLQETSSDEFDLNFLWY